MRQKVSVLYITDTLCSIPTLYVLLNLLMPLFQPPDVTFQPPDATFSIFQECQSFESEVLVWVSPNPYQHFLFTNFLHVFYHIYIISFLKV